MNRAVLQPPSGARRARRSPRGRTRWAGLAWILLILSLGPSARADADASPEEGVQWLRSLLLEARAGLTYVEDYETPRLFTATGADGATWFAQIAQSVAGDWARVDEATSLLLAESDHLRALAAEAAEPRRTRLLEARRLYLEKAAELLATYRETVATVHDSFLGDFLPEDLPDLVFPGEIRIESIAGGGSLDFATGAFTGRLSGEMQLPKFETSLNLLNASFDSRGNFAFSAYGETAFPPDSSEAVTFSVPPRRPLLLQVSETGAFRAAGGVRLDLANGNRLETFFDIDDPRYEFGFSFSGGITLDLAKELTLLRPTIDFDQTADLSLEAWTGLGQFFGSLAQGYESFLADSPALPSLDDLDVGQPPEFADPETAIPFDVLDAWIVGVGNEFVRPTLNGGAEATIAPIRAMLDAFAADLTAAREQATLPSLPQIERLKKVNDLNRKAAAAVREAGAASLLGDDRTDLLDRTQALAEEAAEVAAGFLADMPAAKTDFRTGFSGISFYAGAVASAALVGSDLAIDEALIFSKLDEWRATWLDGYGLNPDGSVKDAATFGTLGHDDLRFLLSAAIDLGAREQALQREPSNALPRVLARHEFELCRARYLAAVAANDLEARAYFAMRLLDLAPIEDLLDFTDPAAPEEALLLLEAFQETWEAVAQSAGGGPTRAKLATSLLRAARHLVEADNQRARRRAADLFGETAGAGVPLPTMAVAEQPPTFLESLSAAFRILAEANLFPPAAEERAQSNSGAFLENYFAALGEAYGDTTLVEQHLRGSLDALETMLDIIAWTRAHLPAEGELLGEFETSWRALHVRWVGMAAAQEQAWLLAAYIRELGAAATRYGEGVGSSLEAAFTTAAREAGDGLEDVVGALASLVDAIGSEAFEFALPGDLRIERLGGLLALDRVTGAWNLAFDGRASFPEVNVVFDLREAALASTGEFELSMLTSGPVPFGLQEGVELEIENAFSLGGNLFTPRLDSFSASGRLFADESATTYDVALDYSFLDPDHLFAVETSFSGPHVLFTDDLLVLEGGFGFNLRTNGGSVPTQGGLATQMKVGLLARPTAEDEVALRDEGDYYLVFEGMAAVGFDTVRQVSTLRLESGQLTLPNDVFTDEENPGPATIALQSVISVEVSLEDGAVTFGDENGNPEVRIGFNNLKADLPGVEGAQLTIANAVLLLSGTAFPVLENIDASFQFPLPGGDADDAAQHRLVQTTITGVNWRIDGFPDAATIALANEVHLVDLEAFDLFVAAGTGLGLEQVTVGAQTRTRLSFEGGIRGEIDGDVLYEPDEAGGGGGAFGFGTSGRFAWDFVDAPEFSLDTLVFTGRMKLGGPGGLELLGVDANGIPTEGSETAASITLEGLDNLFDLAPSRTFAIKVSGALGAADFAYFGLRDARLIFDGEFDLGASPPKLEPEFIVTSLGFREGTQLALLGQELLPFRLTSGSIAFIEDSLPLEERFALTNLRFTVSGEIDISLTEEEGGEDLPRLFGAVENVRLAFPEGFAGPPEFSLNSFGLTLENLSIGDMAGLTGGLFVGNLQTPEDLYFAGTVGGSFNGVGIKAIVATRLDGLMGLCLNVNAGPAGIPLDGGTLGGILLTGAEGGVSFGNAFSDPCDFTSYLGLGPDGAPPGLEGASGESALTPGFVARSSVEAQMPAGEVAAPRVSELPVLRWADLAVLQGFHEQRRALERQATETVEPASAPAPAPGYAVRTATAAMEPETEVVPCPTGDCPPSTLNLLCQRHPSLGLEASAENYALAYAERVIFKFSSLEPEQVDELLATFGIDLDRTPAEIAPEFGLAVRDLVDGLLPRPGPEFIDPVLAAEINATLDAGLEALEILTRDAVLQALAAAEIDPDRSLLDALYEVAYAGIPCQDLTIQLKGTFSWTPISAALSATGGAVVSTTGTAGILGSVNLFGTPVGTGEFFFSATDGNGLPNPSFCGWLRAALGPLELGRADMAYTCDDCVTGVLTAMGNFVAGLSGDTLDAALPILSAYVSEAVGAEVSLTAAELPAYFGPGAALLTQEEQVAVMAAMLNLPEAVRFFEARPELAPTFALEAMEALAEASVTLFLEIYEALDPQFSFCGEVKPSIFGFPLTGGTAPVAVQLYASKTELRGDFAFSPSYVLGNLAFTLGSGGVFPNIIPAIDEAGLGFALRTPAIDRAALEFAATDPLAYAQTQLDAFLEDATLTFNYEMAPFGLKLADGEGRILLPTIDGHPTNPLRIAAEPARFDAQQRYLPPGLPSRPQVLAAALEQNLLGLATWRGKDGDLAALFAPDSAEALGAAGLELGRDYFPHGGFIGAAKVQLPKPITDLPPAEALAALADESAALGQRLSIAQGLLSDYFLAATPVGELSVYLPFPNPPAAFWTSAQEPGEFIRQIGALDIEGLIGEDAAFFPLEQLFMRGTMRTTILGLPLAEGELVADPANGLFLFRTGVPSDSWLHQFVQGAVEVRIATPEYIAATDPESVPETPAALPENRVGAALDLLAAADTPAAQEAAVAEALARLTDTLPKVSLEASLGLTLPPELEDIVEFETGQGFYAFSPRFEPDYDGFSGPHPDPDPSDPGPYTLARRNGGVVAVGNFTFGFNLLDPSGALRIDVEEMSLALTGGTDNPFPNLAGRALVEQFPLPGAFAFGGFESEPMQFGGILSFKSNPGVGENYFVVDGALSPIDFGPFLRVTPLDPEDDQLAGALAVQKTTAGPALSLALRPARAQIPLLGSLGGTIEGLDGGDFTFSTLASEAWSGRITLGGALEVRSPFAFGPDDPVLCVIEPDPLVGGFVAELEGLGLDFLEIRVAIGNGARVTFFPGQAHASSFTIGDDSTTCLLINSEGRIYFDSGTRQLDLAGAAEITGRIEFGFEPVDRVPQIAVLGPPAFAVTAGGSQTQVVRVTNTNPASSQLVVDASLAGAEHFSVTPSRLILGGGESGDLTVRFTPRATSGLSDTLTLAHNAPVPPVTVPLLGSVATVPRFFTPVSLIDFGATPVDTAKSHAVTVTNFGNGPLTIGNPTTIGAAFSDNRGNFTVLPGATQTIMVTFAPTYAGLQSGTLTFTTSDPSAPSRTILLRGIGNDRFWYRQRRGTGSDTLNDIAFHSGGRGHALGAAGNYIFGSAEGRLWERAPLAGAPQLHTVAVADTNRAIAAGAAAQVFETTDGETWGPVSSPVFNGRDFHGAAFAPLTSPIAVLVGEFRGQARIVVQSKDLANFTTEFTSSSVPTLRAVAFGTATTGLAVGDRGTILRTTDSGDTWSVLRPVGIDDGIDLLGIAVNPESPGNYIIVGTKGTIYRTVDAGSNWSRRTSWTEKTLRDVVRVEPDRFVAVGDDGTVVSGTFSGLSWSLENAGTREDFTAVGAVLEGTLPMGTGVWAVTRDGSIFHRQAAPLSGPIAVVNTDSLNLGQIGVGEDVFREVTIVNAGDAPLSFSLDAGTTGFAVEPREPTTVPPGEEARLMVSFTEDRAGVFGGALDVTTNDSAFAVKSLDARVEPRLGKYTPLGYLLLPTRLQLGPVLVGQAVEAQLAVKNLGPVEVELHALEVRHDDPRLAWEASSKMGDVIAGGDEGLLSVQGMATAPGIYTALLEVGSTAANGVAHVEIVLEVVEAPETVIVTTQPAGQTFRLDHDGNGTLSNYTSPQAFAVVEGNAANPHQLRRGTVIEVEARSTVSREGVDYTFQRWTPGTERQFSFVAGESADRSTAVYAARPPAGAPGPWPPLLAPQSCLFTTPEDVSFGPWVRITEARVHTPWLGAEGTDFEVEGSLFLSLDRAYGRLRSSRVRIAVPATTDVPAEFRNLELLEITPGSWDFDISSAGLFRLSTLTPGLQVLDRSARPPEALDVELLLTADELRAGISLRTRDDLPLVPGVLALGPGGLAVETGLDGSGASLFFSLDGSLRALADPGMSSGWMISQPFEFTFDTGNGFGALEFASDRLIGDLGVLAFHARGGSNATSLRPRYAGGVFSLELENLLVAFFGSPERLVVGASIGSDGRLDLSADLPVEGITAPPVRLVPSTSDRAATVSANPIGGALEVSFPALDLNSTDGLWPSGEIEVAAFSFDSEAFDLRLPLPSLSFDGFALEGRDGTDSDNYVEFRRSNSGNALRLRSRQELILGRMQFRFDVDEKTLLGFLSGELGLEGPPPLNLVSDRVSMEYDGSEFELIRTFFGVETRITVEPGDPVDVKIEFP